MGQAAADRPYLTIGKEAKAKPSVARCGKINVLFRQGKERPVDHERQRNRDHLVIALANLAMITGRSIDQQERFVDTFMDAINPSNSESKGVWCLECGQPATWVRSTQFAGNHPFCDHTPGKKKTSAMKTRVTFFGGTSASRKARC